MAQTIDKSKLVWKPQYCRAKKNAAAVAACSASNPKFLSGGCELSANTGQRAFAISERVVGPPAGHEA